MKKTGVVDAAEIFNAISHGVGALLSIAAIVLLIIFGPDESLTGCLVFGISLTILYTASTLYHSFTNIRVKNLFRKFDHMAIFLLIAGTYTPFCLTILKDSYGVPLLIVTWIVAIGGILLKVFLTGKLEWLSLTLYAVMGWLALPFMKTIYHALSTQSFALLVAGGIAYTAGIFFYANEKWRFNHGIWHLFVLAGSCCHFFSVIFI